jgi:hypothetical protein
MNKNRIEGGAVQGARACDSVAAARAYIADSFDWWQYRATALEIRSENTITGPE